MWDNLESVLEPKPSGKNRYRKLAASVLGSSVPLPGAALPIQLSGFKLKTSNISHVRRRAEYMWDQANCQPSLQNDPDKPDKPGKPGKPIKSSGRPIKIIGNPTVRAVAPKKLTIQLPEGLLERQDSKPVHQNRAPYAFLGGFGQPPADEPKIVPSKRPKQPIVTTYLVTKRAEISLPLPKFAFPIVADDEISPIVPQHTMRLPYFVAYKRYDFDERLGLEMIFPRACVEFFATGACRHIDACEGSHIFPSTLKIAQQLGRMNKIQVRQLFDVFVMRSDPMMAHFFEVFAQVFGQKKMVEQLWNMLNQCVSSPKENLCTAANMDVIFRELLRAGLAYMDILANIFMNFPNMTSLMTRSVLSLEIGTKINDEQLYKVSIFA